MSHRAKAVTAGLVVALAVSRLVGLSRSLWQDEAYTAWAYVLRGPGTIRASENYIANNHLLFSALTWAWAQLVGLGEVALRTFAVVPGTVAAAWLAWWLGRRASWPLAATVTGLALVSALQARLVTEARGYGLVLLGAVAMIVGGVDAATKRRWQDDAVLVGGGLVATMTVPTVAIPAAITGLIVLVTRRRDPRAAVRLVALALGAGVVALWWYRPVLDPILAGADRVGARWGDPAGWTSPLIAPAELLGSPSVSHLVPGAPEVLVTVLAVGLLAIGVVALARQLPALAWQVAVVPAATLAVLAVVGFHLLPRYIAMLLPLVLVGIGAGLVTVVSAVADRSRPVAAGIATVGIVLLMVGGGRTVARELTIPQQDFAALATVADEVEPDSVLQAAHHIGFTYYLRDHDPELLTDRAVLEERVCTDPAPVLYLPPAVETEPLPNCIATRGFVEQRFTQRSRPGHISVWVLSEDGPAAIAP